jgi:hypothetical protein
VGDATGQLAQGLHLLGPAQVLSQAQAVGDVFHGGHQGARTTLFVVDHDVVDLDHPGRPVRPAGLALRRAGGVDGLGGYVFGPGRRGPDDGVVEQVGTPAAL